MRNTLAILGILINVAIAAQEQKWNVYIGQSNKDEYVNDVVESYDHGIYMEGVKETSANYKGWQIKTDVNGNILWDKFLVNNEYSFSVNKAIFDSEGNRYAGGTKFINGTWPFIAKFNPCGEKEWCRILDRPGFSWGNSVDIFITDNDEIIVLTQFANINVPIVYDQIWLFALNFDGDMLWYNSYASQYHYPWIRDQVARSLTEHNNQYYISGECDWPFPYDTTHFFMRPLFIGIDSLFNEKWILPFYALDSVIGMAYSSIPINDTVIMGTGIRLYYDQTSTSLLMFYDINGHEINYKEISNDQIGPDINSNLIRKIVRVDDTLFLAAVMFGPDLNLNPGGEFVIDSAANLYKLASHPNTTSASLIKALDNNYVLASEYIAQNGDYNIYLRKIDENLESVPFDTNTYVYDSLCEDTIVSGNINMNDCWIWTGVEEIPSPAQYYARIKTIPITPYPNPATDKVHFKLENTEHNKNIMLKCFNLLGKEMYQTYIIPGQREASTDVSGWNAGMYLVVVYSEGKPVGKTKMVVCR